MNYIEFELRIQPTEPWSDILTAELAELGCDSFIQTTEGVNAYAPEGTIDQEEVYRLVEEYNKESDCEIELVVNRIEEQNWNAAWEADFEPVYVEDRLVILAPFHQMNEPIPLQIHIEPRMSFGTGHHQTTWMMAKTMLDMERMPERVLDMGSGTGVLAILAEKLGANHVVAVDIEEWAYENARDNANRNHCQHIDVRLGGAEQLKDVQVDLILANINKNVLKAQFETYAHVLRAHGTLVISGFFESDREELMEVAEKSNFHYVSHMTRDNWCCVKFRKE
jgi:ribosomal protein L11 methyltransferase